MNTRRIFKPIALTMVLATLLFPMQSVSAAGQEYIGGSADGGVTHYRSFRSITDNSTPGPSVAFNQSFGPGGLRLAAWDCYNDFVFPWGGLQHQQNGEWRFVADGIPNGDFFCLATNVSSGATGSFGGTLAWD